MITKHFEQRRERIQSEKNVLISIFFFVSCPLFAGVAGDIVGLAGFTKASVTDTISDPSVVRPIPVWLEQFW